MIRYIQKLNYFFLVTQKTNTIETRSYSYSCLLSQAAEEASISTEAEFWPLLLALRTLKNDCIKSLYIKKSISTFSCSSLLELSMYHDTLCLCKLCRKLQEFKIFFTDTSEKKKKTPLHWCSHFPLDHTPMQTGTLRENCSAATKANTRVFFPCRLLLFLSVCKSDAGWSLINPFPFLLDWP